MPHLQFFFIRIASFFTGRMRFALALLLTLAACLFILPDHQALSASSGARQAVDMPALRGEEAINHLKAEGTYDSLQATMAAIKYQARWQPAPQLAGLGAGYELKNGANNLLAYVNGDGLQVTAFGGDKKNWRLGLQLKAYGYGDHLTPISSGEVKANQTRVEIKRNSVLSLQSSVLTEWSDNRGRGIEHGFDVAAPPGARKAGEPLRLRFAMSGDWEARIVRERERRVVQPGVGQRLVEL